MPATPSTPATTRAALADWRARVSHDWLADDPHFTSLVPDFPELAPFAHTAATDIDAWARTTNRDEHLPRLARYDADGNRTEAVVFHPDHQRIADAIWDVDLLGRYREAGAEPQTLALLYLLAQNGEGGWCCPMACTAGMIKVCQGAADLPEPWLEGLLNGRLYASQFLTEIQGGSDVGANVLNATPAGDGWYRLTGEKWFCSVIDANLFLVTARPEGARSGTAGLRAFVVPRQTQHIQRLTVNHFEIRRLKWKLGTRSMASGEVDFCGAYGWPVADFGTTVEVVLNTSRLYNAVCAAAFLQRAWREADAYARTRLAFGSPILTFPAIARVVANLKVEAHAARSVTFLLAQMPPGPAFRMLVNLNKIWTALTCPAGVRQAMEVLGGNGAIEEFSVLPRLLRDSLVLEAWEGGHGVLCAQLYRDAKKGLHRPMFAYLGSVGVQVPEVELLWEHTLARVDGEYVWRDVVEASRRPVQAAVLRMQGVPPAIVEQLTAGPALSDEGLQARMAAIVG